MNNKNKNFINYININLKKEENDKKDSFFLKEDYINNDLYNKKDLFEEEKLCNHYMKTGYNFNHYDNLTKTNYTLSKHKYNSGNNIIINNFNIGDSKYIDNDNKFGLDEEINLNNSNITVNNYFINTDSIKINDLISNSNKLDLNKLPNNYIRINDREIEERMKMITKSNLENPQIKEIIKILSEQ